MEGSAKKYNFSNAPKVSKADLALSRIFSSSQVDDSSINRFAQAAVARLEPLPADALSLVLNTIQIESRERALSVVNDTYLCAFGNISSQNIPFALVVSKDTVLRLVHLLLGSKSDISSQKASLTPLEEGIFSFLLAQALDSLQTHFVDLLGASAHLGALSSATSANEVFAPHSQLIHFVFDLIVDKTPTQIRILIAAEPIATLFSNKGGLDKVSVVRNGLSRAFDWQAPVSTVIGQVSLAPEDLKALEVDDIVVLEDSRVKMSGNALTGDLNCFFGEPFFASANARISISQRGKYMIQISNLKAVSIPVSH